MSENTKACTLFYFDVTNWSIKYLVRIPYLQNVQLVNERNMINHFHYQQHQFINNKNKAYNDTN